MVNQAKTIHKIALAYIKDKKVLLVRSKGKEAFYSLGGKVEPGETDIECLVREVREEVGVEIDLKSLKFLTQLEAPAHGRPGVTLYLKLYSGNLLSEPTACSEIEEIGYFDSHMEQHLLSPMTTKELSWLKEHGYIK